MTTHEMPKIITAKDLRGIGIPYSTVHLRRLEKSGGFPRRIQLSANRIGWLSTDIARWIEERRTAPTVANLSN